jgi:hypothetical protein
MTGKVHRMEGESIGEGLAERRPRLRGAGEAVEREQRSTLTGRDDAQTQPVADIDMALLDNARRRHPTHAGSAWSATTTDSHALR